MFVAIQRSEILIAVRFNWIGGQVPPFVTETADGFRCTLADGGDAPICQDDVMLFYGSIPANVAAFQADHPPVRVVDSDDFAVNYIETVDDYMSRR